MDDNGFFHQDAQILAQLLLGKIIRAKYGNEWLSAMIIETEAYYLDDKASHGFIKVITWLKKKHVPNPPGC